MVEHAGYLHNRLGHTHLYIQEGGLGGCGSGSVRQITSGEFDEVGQWHMKERKKPRV